MKKLLRRALKSAALVLGTVLALAVLGEIGLRVAGYGKYPALYYDPRVGYRFFPKQTREMVVGEEVVAHFSTNAIGYRGPSYPVEKPPGTLRIACLGDSFTFGWGVEDRFAYPAQLQELFSSDPAASPVEVQNFGHPGYNVENALATYREVARAYRPDVVVFCYYLNDVAPREVGMKHTDDFLFRLLGRTALADAFNRHLRPRLGFFRATGTEAQRKARKYYNDNWNRIELHPFDPDSKPYWEGAMRALEALSNAVHLDRAEFVLVCIPRRDQVQLLRQEFVRGSPDPEGALDGAVFAPQRYLVDEAAKIDAVYLDLLLPIAELEQGGYGEVDRLHFDERGYSVLANQVAAEVRRILSAKR